MFFLFRRKQEKGMPFTQYGNDFINCIYNIQQSVYKFNH